MAQLIGTVTQVIGQVFAIAGDGSRRVLVEGDRLYVGEQLQTGAEGAVAVTLANGEELTLGRGSSLELSEGVLQNQAANVVVTEDALPSEGQLTEVEQLQQAIAAGEDPTQNADPTAAGPGATTGAPGTGGTIGGHSFVLLSEVGGAVAPTVGFPTEGLAFTPEAPELYVPDLLAVTLDAPGVVVPPFVPAGITITPGDALTVNEAYLQNGTLNGVPDAADQLTQTGSFFISAPDGLTDLSVGGTSVLTGGVVTNLNTPITTGANSTLLITNVNLTTGEVSYQYTLNNPQSVTGAGTNTVLDPIQIVATDAANSTQAGTISVGIVDDVPNAGPVLDTSANSGQVGSNVLIVLDVSDSMKDQSGVLNADGSSKTRMDLAKESINTLLDSYADLGADVRVQIVTFSAEAGALSATWMTVAEAKAAINADSVAPIPEGGTNYDAALAAAKEAFASAGALPDGQNLSYFFSDGIPTLSDTRPVPGNGQSLTQTNPELGDGISDGSNGLPNEKAVWESFLEANNIKSYAIGLGTNADTLYLNPISYDGAGKTELGAVRVTDLSQLDAVLSRTVPGTEVTGTLLGSGETAGSFGADGGFISSISVATSEGTVSFNAGSPQVVGGVLTVTTAIGGTLILNMTNGEYTYTPPKNVTTGGVKDVFNFVLSDNDGDLAVNSLTVNVLPTVTPNSDTTQVNALFADVIDSDSEVQLSAITVGSVNDTVASRLTLERSNFANITNAATAAVVVAGFLAVANTAAAQDIISVSLNKGETLNLDHNLVAGTVGLEYQAADGQWQPITDGAAFTAAETGDYQIRVTNLDTATNASHNYELSLTLDTAAAAQGAARVADTQVDSGATLTGQATAAHVVHGTAEGETVAAVQADDSVVAGDGDDVLVGGAGNNLLDGGAGNDTASYQDATAGVKVDLNQQGVVQDTVGAGLDKLVSIENLIGSDHDDTLIGDAQNNIITGGKGDDVLTGGAGADTFVWKAGDAGHDTVTDFKIGSDTLDLSQLLQGIGAAPGSIDSLLSFKVSGSGAEATSTIEVSSVANGAPTQTIDLHHVDLAAQYGITAGAGGYIAGADSATIINGMISDHALKADTV